MINRKLTKSILAVVSMAALVTGCATTNQTSGPSTFEFETGYPTAESSHALYDEMDYQRAVQAYTGASVL